MKPKYDFYNPIYHKGYLPVRVLSNNIIDSSEKVAPGFLEEAKFEINNEGLYAGIQYLMVANTIMQN